MYRPRYDEKTELKTALSHALQEKTRLALENETLRARIAHLEKVQRSHEQPKNDLIGDWLKKREIADRQHDQRKYTLEALRNGQTVTMDELHKALKPSTGNYALFSHMHGDAA